MHIVNEARLQKVKSVRESDENETLSEHLAKTVPADWIDVRTLRYIVFDLLLFSCFSALSPDRNEAFFLFPYVQYEQMVTVLFLFSSSSAVVFVFLLTFG